MSELEWFSTKRNADGSFSILVPKEWPESMKHKALDAIELGIQAGAEKERERIIKLLEAEGCHCKPDPEAGKCYPHNLIALIKGEQK